ncbi:MAG TPA: hypothetical protein VFS08_08475 [Gemmatimonadaceae bacterium]|nr:hypothetical protein [Gemmatimonadaceae bacterium]
MAFTLGRWRPRHLLLAWGGYWLTLALVVLGRPALLGWRLTHGSDTHGTISAGFENAVVRLTIVEDGLTRWSGSTHLLTMALWLTVPPLLLWLVWLLLQRRPHGARPEGTSAAMAAPGLPASEPAALRAPAVPLATARRAEQPVSAQPVGRERDRGV